MSPTSKNDAAAIWMAEQILPHQAALRAYVLARFPHVPDVDDLVQESCVRAYRARERGAVASPRALLFAVARNLAIDGLRRQRVISFEPIPEESGSSVLVDSENVTETINRRQEFEILTQAIQSLPDRCRQVLTLRKIYGLSQKEISARLGISEHTVETQVATGMKRCAAFFAERGLP